MSVIYWESQSNVQIQVPYGLWYCSPGGVAEKAIGIWHMVPDTVQSIQWQDYVEVQFTGDIRPIWPAATAAPSLQLIVMQRSIGRFVFGGVFRRVN